MTIKTILFDLDDTLYPSNCGVWSLIREKIDQYMKLRLNYSDSDVAEARDGFFREYGTTLRGLQAVHKIDTDDYLNFVHDVPIEDLIQPNNNLKVLLPQLPQRKAIFTNADRLHANRVLKSLQIDIYFEQIIDILDVDPYCKPMQEAFQIALDKLSITDPKTVLYLDDSPRNIATAQSIGIQTIWINNSAFQSQHNGLELARIDDFGNLIPEIMAGWD